ncbi:MAG TPA: SpoIIE family protein phosphatase [Vicinamibacterales bacterium]|nr:SpoIIE family protein phosphatase [Vicinamibacterales bacterium]
MLTMASRPQIAARVLVADDQPDVLEALRWLLTGEGYEPEFVSSTDAVLERLRERSFDLLLMDLNYSRDTTSGREGLELIPKVRALDGSLPIVVMTGWGSVDTAVEAMRHGARSFVQKPWEDITLLEILQREIEEAQATKRSDARQKREFEDARLIQRGLLPTTTPQLAGLRLASSWQPANGVGGDCFDMLTFGTGAMGVYIADVAGKGVPAALLMSNLQAAVRAFAQEGAAPGSVCTSVNRLLCRNMASGRFVTFCYTRIDVAAGKLTYANAGHNPPLLVRANGTIDLLPPGGTVLGVFAESTYEQGDFALHAGDRLVLYTDGITEGRNAAGDEFGEEGLSASASRHRALGADDMLAAMLQDVETFNGGVYEDDATLIVAAL